MPMSSKKNVRVVVMGLGLHGGGEACVRYFVEQGAQVTATDLRTAEILRASVDSLKDISKKITLVLGEHRLSDFQRADIVVKAPGIRNTSPYIQAAIKSGATIENQATVFLKACPATVIGVTGTRGKSTTSALIYDLLSHTKAVRGNVYLGGLPGKPILTLLQKIKPQDIVIIELSSWQLETMGDQKISPHIAVFTNLFADHLNTYSGMNQYLAAKAHIIRWQKKDDIAIIGHDNEYGRRLGATVPGKRIWFGVKNVKDQNSTSLQGDSIVWRVAGKEKKLGSVSRATLTGSHNIQNILGAVSVAGLFGITKTEVEKTLRNFKGLPGRQEVIREVRGISLVNDTTSTMPDATMVALAQKKPTVLIAGGVSKNIPQERYRALAKEIKRHCRAVVLFTGDASEQLARELKKMHVKQVVCEVTDMQAAVGIALQFARRGDRVLLSPGAASFNLFKNEFDRGDQFNAVVRSL